MVQDALAGGRSSLSKRNAILLLVAGIAVVVLAFLLFRKPAPLKVAELSGLPARFMAIVPADVPEEQKAEIEGLLRRFQTKALADLIRPEDYQEVMQLLAEYLTRGSIERGELNLLMAKVGYYSYRSMASDSSDIHPLLDPIEVPSDTMRVRHD
jgi:hypothetical protein